jgi:hypothetical protein
MSLGLIQGHDLILLEIAKNCDPDFVLAPLGVGEI